MKEPKICFASVDIKTGYCPFLGCPGVSECSLFQQVKQHIQAISTQTVPVEPLQSNSKPITAQ